MKRYLLSALITIFALNMSATVKPRFGRGTPDSEQTNNENVDHQNGPRKIGNQASAPLKAKGSPKVPVILVQFTDLKFISGLGSTTDSQGNEVVNQCLSDEDVAKVNSFFNLFCNGNGEEGGYYTGAGSFGAIREYFRDQSQGQFTPEFVVIGPVTLDNGYAYYGKNSSSKKDVNLSTFYKDAITKAQQIFTDWSLFDNDKNNVVDMAFFIFAGEGENGGGGTNTIWPQERASGGTLNNVKYGCYACCNETFKGKTDGIGVFCHELSHAMGLPDFYDTNYVAYGLDYFDVMDSGCYCNDALTPCNYSTYERDFMGWQSLVTLNSMESQTITLYPVDNGGKGYKIVNPENPNEYLVIENRQTLGWDSYLGKGTDRTKMHGMMVMRVNYNSSSWSANSVNTNKTNQRITIVPADNNLRSYMWVNDYDDYNEFYLSTIGDLFPGAKGVTALKGTHAVDYSYYDSQEVEVIDPATGEPMIDPETGVKVTEIKKTLYSYDWSTSDFGQPITNIVEHEDGTITFDFCADATAINSLFENRKENVPVYNAMGVMVATTTIEYGRPTYLPTQNGIYIVNGRKYIK